jgi:hypothetical protein
MLYLKLNKSNLQVKKLNERNNFFMTHASLTKWCKILYFSNVIIEENILCFYSSNQTVILSNLISFNIPIKQKYLQQ